MGEGWAAGAWPRARPTCTAAGSLFFEPEGEHAAAGVTAGMSMTGLRSTNFSSGQGIAYMHESLYAAAGKRLTYVLNVAARAMTKHALNVHAGHDDYHAVDDTGFFQLFAKDVQEARRLQPHRPPHRRAVAQPRALNAQDGFLTSHVIETVRLPEPELVKRVPRRSGGHHRLADAGPAARRSASSAAASPSCSTSTTRRCSASVQNQDSYAQGVAAQRPFYFDHIAALADQAFAEYAALTGRRYARAIGLPDRGRRVRPGRPGLGGANRRSVADHLRENGASRSAC